jgi:hypothetical protein
MRRMSPVFVVGAFGGTRIAIGIAFALVPDRLTGPLDGPPSTLMTRSFAVRELVLGVGGVFAAANADAWPSAVRMWAALGALTDAADLAAAVVDARRGDPSVRASALVAATGFVAEFWAFRSRSKPTMGHS